MRIFWNILLCLFALVCIAALVLQGFGLPQFTPWIDVLLRIGAAFFAQWFFFRAARKKRRRFFPLLLPAFLTVWGLFLYLSSPSWRNATLLHFFGDYASFFLACAGFFFLRWALPRLLPRMKKGIVLLFTRRKRNKASKKDMPRFR